MVSVEQNGTYITLEEGEHVFSNEVDVYTFKGKVVVTPNTVDSVVLIQGKDKYYLAQFTGKWYVFNIEKMEPLGLTLTIPMSYMKPSMLCNTVMCAPIKTFIDETNYVVYPTSTTRPSLIQVEGEHERLVYAFIPDFGWVKV